MARQSVGQVFEQSVISRRFKNLQAYGLVAALVEFIIEMIQLKQMPWVIGIFISAAWDTFDSSWCWLIWRLLWRHEYGCSRVMVMHDVHWSVIVMAAEIGGHTGWNEGYDEGNW